MSAILRAHAQLASGIASADHDTGHENVISIHEPATVLQLTVLRVGAANSSRTSQKVLDRYAPSILADWLVMSMQGLRYGKSHVESGRDGACRELRVSNANRKISPRSCVWRIVQRPRDRPRSSGSIRHRRTSLDWVISGSALPLH